MKKACDLLEKFLYGIGMAAVALFFLCTVVQVISRITGIQAAFTEEVANAALAWCCFIGAAPLVRSNDHFRFTAFCEKLKGKGFWVNEFAVLLMVLAFNMLIAYHGTLLVKQFATWRMSSLPAVSRAWIWLCVPVCGYSAVVFSVENLINFVKNPSGRRIVSAVDEAMKEVE